MDIDFDALTLSEFLELQSRIGKELRSRFERPLAVVYLEIVPGSAAEHREGSSAGGLEHDWSVLGELLATTDGKLVDKTAEGALCYFESVDRAAHALIELQERLCQDELELGAPLSYGYRAGLCWGPVLTDGETMMGDAMRLCAQVARSGRAGEIRLDAGAFAELSGALRSRCSAIPSAKVKGTTAPVRILLLDWRDPAKFPSTVTIEETGERIRLPNAASTSFGRLASHEGVKISDVVLQLADENKSKRISRRHFVLERRPDGYVLRCLSPRSTVVDGTEVPEGGEVALRPDSEVSLARVMTLRFRPAKAAESDAQDTIGSLADFDSRS